MTPDRFSGRGGLPAHRVTRRSQSIALNSSAHHTQDDTITDTITQLGQLAQQLDLTDESDARIYSRRVSATLTRMPLPLVGRVLDELGGDSGRHRSMTQRIDAVHAIVSRVAYWHR